MTPAELIRAILRSPVDLLFNGGIGNYVKASSEAHADAGDRANDSVRIDAPELRCRVIGEGGNLGLTQLARVEYALADGRVSTDFIDNSGGVDCSDREVNIKILLDSVVASDDMTEKQRNELLADMTDSVAALVLADSYSHAQALGIARAQAPAMISRRSLWSCIAVAKRSGSGGGKYRSSSSAR
jgi:glutamate dehydrogenase